jgi:protein-S-isoprenylcysteine O-methyltransferase Ste14
MGPLTPLALFGLLSVPALVLSIRELANPRSHGFYRFFAFEGVLGLVCLNSRAWFAHAFAVRQVVSWVLLLGSMVLAAHGFHTLRSFGRPSGSIEATTQLVRKGAYRYIRHPLYTSLLLLGWGAFLKDVGWGSTALVLFSTLAIFVTGRVEETECLERFGPAYQAYMRETRMFIPFVL